MSDTLELKTILTKLKERYGEQNDFLQAVDEVLPDILPYINQREDYLKHHILDRLLEPEQIINFKVVWEDDNGRLRVNRGYRVQFNNAIGPYKGGLRFHPSVNEGMFKFLSFEQIFKNSLTGLPMGAGKGGSDFNPKEHSEREIRRFCRAFMLKLYPHIGPHRDVPAGDMGVGGREIGFLHGMYQELTGRFEGTMTGKGVSFGGSNMRTEATGYGLAYFAKEMLRYHGKDLKGKRALVSGAGNVSLHAAEKLIEMGVKVLTLSDTSGVIYTEQGLGQQNLREIETRKQAGESLKEIAQDLDVSVLRNKTPWHKKADLAFPCATQNELNGKAAQQLIDNGCELVAEGANMPSTAEAVELLRASDILYAPGKAANAGGVGVSGLEMHQNASFDAWSREEVDQRLQKMMQDIHQRCVDEGRTDTGVDYVKGANVAGFKKVAEAMLATG